MPSFETIAADAAWWLKLIEGWAVSQHQKTDDAGFLGLANLARKLGAAAAAPENAADIAAVKAMVAQDFPSAPPKPAPSSAADVPLDNTARTQTPQQFNQWQAEHPGG